MSIRALITVKLAPHFSGGGFINKVVSHSFGNIK